MRSGRAGARRATVLPTPLPPDRVGERRSARAVHGGAPADAAALRHGGRPADRGGRNRSRRSPCSGKAVEAAPTAKNHGDLGTLLYTLTAFDEAAVHLRAAAELEPGNADRWIALANVYYRKVNPGEAWKAEKRAREAEPGLELGRDGTGMRVRQGAAPPP